MRWPVWLAPVRGLTEGFAGVDSLGGEMRIGPPNFMLWLELREAKNVSVSTRWLHDSMVHISSSNWLQYIKVWINALPTRIRTPRGSRRLREDVSCRGGCRVQETAAHVVQQCFRTHGGRIMRHDAVASTLAGELQRGGYSVHQEHVFRTCEGVRKPDIVATKAYMNISWMCKSYPELDHYLTGIIGSVITTQTMWICFLGLTICYKYRCVTWRCPL